MSKPSSDWDVELIRSAGIAPRHLAAVMNVHRITAANWLTNQNNPHHLLAGRAARLMRAVRLALEDHSLPIAKDQGFQSSEIDVRTVATLRALMKEDEEEDNA